MKLITKDRHLEAIVEKLCHRIRGALDERQCIDLSYCLTLISYSEKTFQKLLDNIICYADKLNYARVHRNFTTIIINCKKLKTGKVSDRINRAVGKRLKIFDYFVTDYRLVKLLSNWIKKFPSYYRKEWTI